LRFSLTGIFDFVGVLVIAFVWVLRLTQGVRAQHKGGSAAYQRHARRSQKRPPGEAFLGHYLIVGQGFGAFCFRPSLSILLIGSAPFLSL